VEIAIAAILAVVVFTVLSIDVIRGPGSRDSRGTDSH
jgi:hypothetical protein